MARRRRPMEQSSTDDGAWFAPRRYGYGAGLPIAWQGWALVAAWLVMLALVGVLDRMEQDAARISGFALFIAGTATFLSIVAKRTRGGWRWRWGSKDLPPDRSEAGRRPRR